MRRAAVRGVDFFALTDHDETAGLAEARIAAQDAGIALVPGAELSVSWEAHTLHILGLNIDEANAMLDAGLASIRVGPGCDARTGLPRDWKRPASKARTRVRAGTSPATA